MGISNYVPSSRVSQAGVCTSTTRPASPYEGQMIYETDTNRVLVYDNTAWVMIADTDTPPGLVLIKTDTITSGTSKEITGVFSSEFTNYRVVINAINTSALIGINFRFGTTATGYYGSLYYDNSNGTSTSTNRASNATQLQIGYGSTFTGNGFSTFDVSNPNTTLAHKGITGTYNGEGYTGFFGGVLASSTQFTSFTIRTDGTQTFSNCDISVYGYRK